METASEADHQRRLHGLNLGKWGNCCSPVKANATTQFLRRVSYKILPLSSTSFNYGGFRPRTSPLGSYSCFALAHLSHLSFWTRPWKVILSHCAMENFHVKVGPSTSRVSSEALHLFLYQNASCSCSSFKDNLSAVGNEVVVLSAATLAWLDWLARDKSVLHRRRKSQGTEAD